MAKYLLECTMCGHAWTSEKRPRSVRCPGCGKSLAFTQTPTFLDISEVAPNIARIFDAAKSLAHAEQSRRDLVSAVDWSKCERGYEDGRAACATERDTFTPPDDDPFGTYESCPTCQRNRDLLIGAQHKKTDRRNAINRIVRAMKRNDVTGEEG